LATVPLEILLALAIGYISAVANGQSIHGATMFLEFLVVPVPPWPIRFSVANTPSDKKEVDMPRVQVTSESMID